MTELENAFTEMGRSLLVSGNATKVIQHKPGMPRKSPLATRDSNCW